MAATPLTLRPATRADLANIAYTQADSAAGDEICTYIGRPGASHATFRAFVLTRVRERFVTPRLRYMVEAGPSGEIAGLLSARVVGPHPLGAQADWTTHGALYGGLERALIQLDRAYRRAIGQAPVNFAAYDAFGEAWQRAMEAVPEPYIEVVNLNVRPEDQGRGVARRLLEWVQGVAREHGMGVVLSSTDRGFPVYQRLGFRQIGVVETRETAGVEGVLRQRLMGWGLGEEVFEKRAGAGTAGTEGE